MENSKELEQEVEILKLIQEREEILKKGKIPWYGQLICGIIFIASFLFLFIPAIVFAASEQKDWVSCIVCLSLFVIVNAVWILIANNSEKGKRYKKLGQEIEKLKTKLEYLKKKGKKEQG